jgi:hypothetical protein
MGVSILYPSPPAEAQEPPKVKADDAPKATALAEAALARVKQGDLRTAIDLYEEAYAISPRREYLREIGAIYDTLAFAGDSRDVRLAILYLERALVDEGPTPERSNVEARLARLRGWKARMRSEPMQPRLSQVPIQVMAYKPELTFDVEIGPAKCTTPCTLTLPPGTAMLRASGPGKIEQPIVIPARPGVLRLHHADSSTFTAGAILVPTGLVVGGSMWAFALLCRDTGCTLTNLILWPVVGLTTLVTGIALLATGRVVPPADANRVEIVGRAGPRFRVTSVGFAPTPGGASGGLTVEF